MGMQWIDPYMKWMPSTVVGRTVRSLARKGGPFRAVQLPDVVSQLGLCQACKHLGLAMQYVA